MSNCCSLMEIADRSVKDISRRVARLEMSNHPTVKVNPNHGKTMMAIVKGDYNLAILFYADERVLSAIAENMKRNRITDEAEVSIYIAEYFNILCGNVVSAFNLFSHSSARFRIPEFVTGPFDSNCSIKCGHMQELCYRCPYGTAKFQAICYS